MRPGSSARSSPVAVHSTYSPRGSTGGGACSFHSVDLLLPGTHRTVAGLYGQHQPATANRDSGPVPNVWLMFETVRTRGLGITRMNTHWSAVVQSTSSHRRSGDHASPAKTPMPEKMTLRRAYCGPLYTD